MNTQAKYLALLGAWILCCLGTLGSLVASEVYGFVPCPLCWYQRIALFPLVWLLGLATYDMNLEIVRYVKGLVVFGLAISLYQVILLHPSFTKTCSLGCSFAYNQPGLFWLPILSLINFGIIFWLLNFSKK